MISIQKILTVSVFEAKTLFRSWFFRIFSLLALVILVLLDIFLFCIPTSSWMIRGLGASIPYMNLLLLNAAQAVIAVFVASEFLKFDYKLDTTEAIYARSMTNADYVLGKTLGVLVVFVILNIVVLGISFIFNFFFTEVPVIPEVYLYYPLLISLPTLVFIFGLSFLLMVTIRNQAVTFIILLGYIASTLFFLSGRFHHVFDYMAYTVPLMYSEMAGFGNISTILMQRGIYVSLGAGFIFLTIVLLKRLSQSKAMTVVSFILAVAFIGAGIVLGERYIERLEAGKKLREEMRALNRDIMRMPPVSLASCLVSLNHLGNEIEVDAKLTFSNKTDQPIEKYRFSLNPGLTVSEVKHNGQNLRFERNLHIVTIEPGSPLAPGSADSLTIFYRGTINEDAAYIDIDEAIRNEGFAFWVYNVDKRYAFITPRNALLTSEDLWYPVAGIPYGAAYPELGRKNFIKFELKVKTLPGLTAVSQGAQSNPAPGSFEFKPEPALPQLSLAIGKYERYSVTSEGIEYNLYLTKGHDFFSKYLTEIKGDLPEILDECMQDFERKLDISYPYKRLSLVEIPIQFYAYPRIWTVTSENIQPEQVFLPEKGVLLLDADFKRSSYLMNYWMKRGRPGPGGSSGQVMTEKELQKNLFNRFVESTFAGNIFDTMIRRSIIGFSSRNDFPLRRLSFATRMSILNIPDYNLFPQFYTFVNHIHSTDWPIIDLALENYLHQTRTKGDYRPSFSRGQVSSVFRYLMTNEANAKNALQKQSLAEILADPGKKDIVSYVLSSKGNYLLPYIQSRTGTEAFNTFLSDFLYNNQFRDIDCMNLLQALNQKYSFDLKTFLDDWYNRKGLPAFLVGNMQCREVVSGDRTRYNVIFAVSNPETSEGLVSVDFTLGGSGSSGSITRYINLKGGETKEIGVLLDSAPRMATIKTFISQNIPTIFNRNFGKPETNAQSEVFEGERVLSKPISLSEPGEIIVDDEDEGFQIVSLGKESFLKTLLKKRGSKENEYVQFAVWRPPNNWKHTVQGDFFGIYRHSAYFIKSGDGSKKAVWKADIPENGNYSIYCYITKIREYQQPSMESDYHYLLHHDDGIEEIEFDNNQSPEGWNLLGTFYLSAGTAEVELTNKSRGRVVIADAIKWVKRI